MPRASKDQKDKLRQLRERFQKAVDADLSNRRKAVDDLKFVHVPGEQWDDNVRAERGARPTLEFNKLRVTIKRVINDIRANRPSGKVRGVEEGDKATAEILEGLIRNIWNVSDGDTVIDQAAEYQVACGFGAWRVDVDYANDSAFEQDIRITGIPNPLNLYPDPACQDPLKRDARYWFYTSRMAKESFQARWPKAEVVDFGEDGVEFDDEDEWDDGETVRICEYWYREPYTRTLALLSNGATVDANQATMESLQGLEVVRTREVVAHRIRMCIASGSAILEEGEWAGENFPFVVVHGEHVVVDGERLWWGLARFAKDAQRAYNYSRTLAVETVALAPQAKFWATPAQAQGHIEKWAEAHKKNYPFLLSNPDPQMPGFPQRMPGAEIPAALLQEVQFASEDIKGVTGIYDASLGARSNETTGIAIRARQAQGEVAVFNYGDNLAKGIRRTWEILVDLIPKVYDTQRSVRILGQDGAEKYATVNQVNPVTGEVLNDLSRGRYDVTVTVGPSFSTQRQEAAEAYMGLAQANPAIFGVAGDLIFKALDLPYADQIADRLKMTLPPQIQQAEQGDKPMPPEVMQAMAQADGAMQQVQAMAQQMQADAAQLQGEKAEVERAKSDLQVQAAKLQADYQRMVADLTKREAEIQVAIAQAQSDADRQQAQREGEAAKVEASQAVAQIQAQADEFMRKAYEILTGPVEGPVQ